MTNGFIALPRSFLQDRRWVDSPPAYQHVFLKMIEFACYEPTSIEYRGTSIDLKPGQLFMSWSEILDICSKFVSRNDVQRCIRFYRLCGFISLRADEPVIQKVIQSKSLITFTDSRIYNTCFRVSDPVSDPVLRSPHTSNNKNNKNTVREASALASSLVEFFVHSLHSNLPDSRGSAAPAAKAALIFDQLLRKYSEAEIQHVITWSHQDSFWSKLVLRPSYLKAKFDQLHLAANAKSAKSKKSVTDFFPEPERV